MISACGEFFEIGENGSGSPSGGAGVGVRDFLVLGGGFGILRILGTQFSVPFEVVTLHEVVPMCDTVHSVFRTR